MCLPIWNHRRDNNSPGYPDQAGQLGDLGAHRDAPLDVAVEPAVQGAGDEGVARAGAVDDRDGLDLEGPVPLRGGQVGAGASVGGHDRGRAHLLAQGPAHLQALAPDAEDDAGVGTGAEEDG